MVTLSLTAEQIDQLRNIAAVGGKWLMAAFTALGGLAGIAKIITTFVARKKPVKLNQSDYEAIANAIVECVLVVCVASCEQDGGHCYHGHSYK